MMPAFQARKLRNLTVDEVMNMLDFANGENAHEPSAAAVEDMSQDYVSVLESAQLLEQPAVLTAGLSEFICYFSTTKFVSSKTPDLPQDVETGNSRLAPTKFLHLCRRKGCMRGFDSSLHRDEHEVSCKGVPMDDLSEGDHQEAVPTGRKRS